MSSQFRIITMDGKVSEEIFQILRPSEKNKLIVESESGARLTVHKRRIISVDSLGKAVAVKKGSTIKAVCPGCSEVIEVIDNEIECPVHGKYDITSHDQNLQSVNMVRRSKTPQQDRSNKPMASDLAADIGTVVDLEEITKFGKELWTKSQLHFDHVNMDVKAHVLLADEPVRKLCFNTYDGTLGKKKKFEDLHLEDFKTNTPVQGKKLWHLLKGTLDEARQHLQKKGYTRA